MLQVKRFSRVILYGFIIFSPLSNSLRPAVDMYISMTVYYGVLQRKEVGICSQALNWSCSKCPGSQLYAEFDFEQDRGAQVYFHQRQNILHSHSPKSIVCGYNVNAVNISDLISIKIHLQFLINRVAEQKFFVSYLCVFSIQQILKYHKQIICKITFFFFDKNL